MNLSKMFLYFFSSIILQIEKKIYLCTAFERKCNPLKGRLAQLVQSIWFTPRGSAVRTRHRPLISTTYTKTIRKSS